ncbi:hypothetical protein Caci_2824 [Catenulispora acidiphila DSM 44928]|uniref:Uncharacterized protein n=1 Tax=Catenulispora acidiphila (strain DSM 44928 / JCM 14897 / NBRC 102108 / NRRL B-24433 / ID139908) TaxID=479433 RepID=C7Q158_CATAD|nr:hypothetical protein [Catenulispora acidiphila]ACU71733.1 hypothetical protein Caci_2824 [Catenulispora acidiphila DSM 44928]
MNVTTGTIVQLDSGEYGISGDATALADAYTNSTPIAPTNAPYAADLLYLGSTRETYGDYGRSLETLGLAYIKDDGQAVYYLNTNRLDQAPALAEAFGQFDNYGYDAADDDYINPRYM